MLGGGVWLVGYWERSQELAAWVARLGFVVLVWLVGWPVWETVRVAGNRVGSPRR